MARPLRLLYENAWYHVMNRGASRTTTFHDNNDYQTFINLFLQLHNRYRFEIHVYCLMPNHYHILIRTPLANLSAGMKHLNSAYTRYYNQKYKKDGSLFRGRYKAILVDAKNYLLRVSRYIHLNPVKACIAKHPGKYKWSSYLSYTGRAVTLDCLYTEEILSYFGTKQRKNKYSLFVMENTDRELEIFYRKTKLLPILGSDSFRKQISKTIFAEMLPIKEIPDQKMVRVIPKPKDICKVVAKYYQVSLTSLFKSMPSKGNLPRKMAVYLTAEFSGRKFETIADFFKNTSAIGVSQIVFRINKLKLKSSAVKKDIAKLCKLIQD